MKTAATIPTTKTSKLSTFTLLVAALAVAASLGATASVNVAVAATASCAATMGFAATCVAVTRASAEPPPGLVRTKTSPKENLEERALVKDSKVRVFGQSQAS